MAHVITVANQKGGTGKTLTVQSFAAGLVRNWKRVLMVDLDMQRNLSYSVGLGDYHSPCDVYGALTGACSTAASILPTACECGDIILGSGELADAGALQSVTALRDALESVRGGYDFVIVDAPPGLGIVSLNALVASDSVLIPACADMLSLAGVRGLGDTIEDLGEHGYPIYVAGLLVTRFLPQTRMGARVLPLLEECAKDLGTEVLGTRIRECNAAREAQSCCENIYEWQPHSNATADYSAALDEYLKIIGKDN